jgi:micrococcal nuclease
MYEYRATVVRWVDGDTVDVDIDLGFGVILSNKRVRLYGIDAPESRTRDLEEKRLGKAAHHFVEGFAPAGSVVTLRTYKSGKFGRILAEVILDEANINKLLVSEGHAVPYP